MFVVVVVCMWSKYVKRWHESFFFCTYPSIDILKHSIGYKTDRILYIFCVLALCRYMNDIRTTTTTTKRITYEKNDLTSNMSRTYTRRSKESLCVCMARRAMNKKSRKYHAKRYNILKSSIKGAHHVVHFLHSTEVRSMCRRMD